jgi:hypothetical protein
VSRYTLLGYTSFARLASPRAPRKGRRGSPARRVRAFGASLAPPADDIRDMPSWDEPGEIVNPAPASTAPPVASRFVARPRPASRSAPATWVWLWCAVGPSQFNSRGAPPIDVRTGWRCPVCRFQFVVKPDPVRQPSVVHPAWRQHRAEDHIHGCGADLVGRAVEPDTATNLFPDAA